MKIVEFFIRSVWRNKFKKIGYSGTDERGLCEDSGGEKNTSLQGYWSVDAYIGQ